MTPAQQKALDKIYASEYAKHLGLTGTVEQMRKAANPMTDSTFSGNAGLGYDLADAFIDLVVDESVLLRSIQVRRTNFRAGEFSKLTSPGYVTRKATENSTSTETRAIVNRPLLYVTQKSRSDFDITGEVAEDNIERESGVNTILNALIKQVNNDMEVLSIRGDESVSATDDFSSLVKVNDGYLVQTSLTNGSGVVSGGGKRISRKLLRQMLQNLPTRHRRDKSRLRWIMSPNMMLDLQEEAADRSTNFGDTMWSSGQPPAPFGIPVLEIPLWPEDLTASGTSSTASPIMLCDPKNLVYIVQRDIQIEQERIPRYDRTEISVFMRTDFLIEDYTAVVKTANVVLDPGATRYGA